MKESRFVELLNLYVDQELAPAEAAELEQEIARNPARRRTYEHYCRMHRACVMLFEKERAPAPYLTKLNEAVREADEKVVAFPGAVLATGEGGARSRAWFGSTWTAAGLVAAAACVAFVVMRQTPTASVVNTTSPATAVATLERPTVTGAREEAVAIPRTVTSPRSNYAPVLVANTLLRGHDSTSETAPLSFTSEGAALEWMNRVQLSPLQNVSAEDLVFEGRSLQSPESRTYRGRNPYAADAEMTAFQFQR